MLRIGHYARHRYYLLTPSLNHTGGLRRDAFFGHSGIDVGSLSEFMHTRHSQTTPRLDAASTDAE